MRVPDALAETWRREGDWLAALPLLAVECAEQWGLTLEAPVDTPHSLVVPAGEVVLKINAPSHFEADHEVDALALWRGAGAVHLVARDDDRRAFVMERCRPATRLWDSDADEVEVVSGLLSRLSLKLKDDRPFRRLTDEAARWAEQIPRRYEQGGRPFERSLVELATDVYESVDHAALTLVNQDLHGWNILRSTREPWLVIDPKPLVGEPELNAVGLLRNAVFRGGRASVERWLNGLEGLGLNRERLRGWGIAHALAWAWDDEDGWSDDLVRAARTIGDANGSQSSHGRA